MNWLVYKLFDFRVRIIYKYGEDNLPAAPTPMQHDWYI